LARESMCLAITALGGDPRQSEYVVSRESMEDSPVQAMAVTVEGIGSTSKKIYEGIKLLFKKIANQIKKMVAKLVVAMNRTGKKAEKMLKNFKNQKDKKPKSSSLEDDVRDKIIKRAGGIFAYASVETNEDAYAAYDRMADNIDKVIDDISGNTEDILKLDSDSIRARITTGDREKNDIAKAKLAEALHIDASGISNKVGSAWANAALKLVTPETVKAFEGAAKLRARVESEMKSSSGLSDAEYEGAAMVPIYAKGPNLYFSVVYHTDATTERAAELTKDGDNDGAAIESARYTVKNISVDLFSDGSDKSAPVMTPDVITKGLTAMKSSSKKLKTFSDKRMKSMDKVMKVVNDAAKKSSGLTIINRLKDNNANKLRTVVASTFISSIFAMASCEKGLLYTYAQHIDVYES